MSELFKAPNPRREWGEFGELVDGIDIPVFNEREIRASAGILFLIGFFGYVVTLTTGFMLPLRAFAVLFLFDMIIRLFISPRFSPTMALGRLAVYRQRPEFVGASQKRWAWWLGLSLALISCFVMGWLAAPLWITLLMCGVCMGVMFFETAFGICLGCELQRVFSKEKPQLCPGDSCNYDPKGS